MHIFLSLLMTGLIFLSLPAHAQPPIPMSAQAGANAADIVKLLEVLDSAARWRAAELAAQRSPAQRDTVRAFLAHASDEEYNRRIAAVMAPRFTGGEAREIARVAASSTFLKSERLRRQARSPDAPEISISVRHGANAAANARVMQLLVDKLNAMVPQRRDAIREWEESFVQPLQRRYRERLAKVWEEMHRPTDSGEPRHPVFKPVGVEYMDQMGEIIATALIEAGNARNAFEFRNKQMFDQDDLSAAMLADPARVKRAIDNTQILLGHLDEMVTIYATSIRKRENATRELVARKQIPLEESIDNVVGNLYQSLLDNARDIRGVLNDRIEVLKFLDSRAGKLQLAEGKLMFGSEEDMLAFNALVEKMNASSAALNDSVDKERARERERAQLNKPG